jgi:hypothetical protein
MLLTSRLTFLRTTSSVNTDTHTGFSSAQNESMYRVIKCMSRPLDDKNVICEPLAIGMIFSCRNSENYDSSKNELQTRNKRNSHFLVYECLFCEF